MRPRWQGVAWVVAFGSYNTVLAYLSLWENRGDAEIAVLVPLFGLGVLIGYVFWPAMAASPTPWRPTWARLAGASVIGIVFALVTTPVFALVLRSDPTPSSFTRSLLIGLLMAYLAWPNIEREIDQRFGR